MYWHRCSQFSVTVVGAAMILFFLSLPLGPSLSIHDDSMASAASEPTSQIKATSPNPTCGSIGTEEGCVSYTSNELSFSFGGYSNAPHAEKYVYFYTGHNISFRDTLSWNGPADTISFPLISEGVTKPVIRGYFTVCPPEGTCAFVNFSFVTGAAAPNPYVAIASTPDGQGYWVVQSNGAVAAFGDATWYGDASSLTLNDGIVAMAVTPDGKGYWLLGGDGGIFSYGDAQFHGSTGNLTLNAPVVGMAATPDGNGYWLVASDGGIFAFGDAQFYGSMGGKPLNQPVVGMAADSATGGYWLVAADGGIFAFDAPFEGSTGSLSLVGPIIGMSAAVNGSGYRFVGEDGGVFCFNQPFAGGLSYFTQGDIVTSLAAYQTSGYWLLEADGAIESFGGAPLVGEPTSLG